MQYLLFAGLLLSVLLTGVIRTRQTSWGRVFVICVVLNFIAYLIALSAGLFGQEEIGYSAAIRHYAAIIVMFLPIVLNIQFRFMSWRWLLPAAFFGAVLIQGAIDARSLILPVYIVCLAILSFYQVAFAPVLNAINLISVAWQVLVMNTAFREIDFLFWLKLFEHYLYLPGWIEIILAVFSTIVSFLPWIERN